MSDEAWTWKAYDSGLGVPVMRLIDSTGKPVPWTSDPKTAALIASAPKLATMLRRLEWATPEGRCPFCNWYEVTGHDVERCDLAALLRDLP